MDGGSFRLCYDGFPAFLCSSSTYFVTRTKWPHKFYIKERKKERKLFVYFELGQSSLRCSDLLKIYCKNFLKANR